MRGLFRPPIRHKFLTAALLMMSASSTVAAGPDLQGYGDLLERYVSERGVRYDAWRDAPADVQALSRAVAELEATRSDGLTPAERVALQINLYNAKVLEIVLQGHPTRSIKDLSRGFNPYEIFTRKVVEFDGKKISLKQLEDRLRSDSEDPRIHFAINCASRSCPPIAPRPYREKTLDEQLNEATRLFLASPGALNVTAAKTLFGTPIVRLSVSRIFSWYAKDFAAAGGVPEFIRAHAPADIAERVQASGDGLRLTYQKYDWSLNAAP